MAAVRQQLDVHNLSILQYTDNNQTQRSSFILWTLSDYELYRVDEVDEKNDWVAVWDQKLCIIDFYKTHWVIIFD